MANNKKTSTKNDKKKTEQTWTGPKDARSEKGAAKYPNQHVLKTRSGHSIIYDDSKDNESMTIQHRGGSCIMFMPDGAVHMTTHNGRYDIVFGEDRMTVTGAHDITVKGDGSLRVYGDYRKTVHGNVEVSATGSITYRGNNITHLASVNHTIVAELGNHKFGTAAELSAPHVSVVGSDSAAFVGREKAFFGGKKAEVAGTDELKSGSEKGSVYTHSKKDYHKVVGGAKKTKVTGRVDFLTDGDAYFGIKGDSHNKVGKNIYKDADQDIRMQSKRAKDPEDANETDVNSNRVGDSGNQEKNNDKLRE